MLTELQTEKMGASNGFQRKDNKENIAYDKMLESSCNEHQQVCTIASFETQLLYSKTGSKHSTTTSVTNKQFHATSVTRQYSTSGVLCST